MNLTIRINQGRIVLSNAERPLGSADFLFKRMKNHLIYPAVLSLASLTLFPACKDNANQTEETAQTSSEQKETNQVPEPGQVEKLFNLALEQVQAGQIASAISDTLEDIQFSKNEDGSFAVSAQLPLKLNEDLFLRQEAPAVFNEERKAINEKANAAVLPESVYLMQVGASTDMLTEESRAASALPENLQAMYDELRNLAESSVLVQAAQGGLNLTLPVTAKASWNQADSSWEYTEAQVQQEALSEYNNLIPRSSLEEGARILTPEFETSLKSILQEKIQAFNEAADTYIHEREGNARAAVAELTAQREEQIRHAAEEQAARDARKQAWEQTCSDQLSAGQKFTGEWVRNNRFGEITLAIATSKRFANSVQFFGTIYDTKLPEACLDVEGRCDFAEDDNGAKVDITIYDGQYDPDQPTAEVYDAKDGMLELRLSPDGKLQGVMTCSSWASHPEKAFQVNLSRAQDKGKSEQRRHSRR